MHKIKIVKKKKVPKEDKLMVRLKQIEDDENGLNNGIKTPEEVSAHDLDGFSKMQQAVAEHNLTRLRDLYVRFSFKS